MAWKRVLADGRPWEISPIRKFPKESVRVGRARGIDFESGLGGSEAVGGRRCLDWAILGGRRAPLGHRDVADPRSAVQK